MNKYMMLKWKCFYTCLTEKQKSMINAIMQYYGKYRHTFTTHVQGDWL